jgi:2-C-methyl-D-erythritol 2,4-cyclodiphosphate synthase
LSREAQTSAFSDSESPIMLTNLRIGHGYDLHRLETGGSLVLAGIKVSDDLHTIAHSDGDVVIHAIVDALLGAMGWGDIGVHYPDTDSRWKGASSRQFLKTTYEQVVQAGYKLQNLDVTILAERPKLKPFKQSMRHALAEMLETIVEQINIKAGTNEGCDAIGKGEAIAAHAVLLLGQAN